MDNIYNLLHPTEQHLQYFGQLVHLLFGIRQSSIAANGAEVIAYCWTEIEGFSKFGSYIGNGNADGPFVYCGFKPAWVMVKNVDDTGGRNWRYSRLVENQQTPVINT